MIYKIPQNAVVNEITTYEPSIVANLNTLDPSGTTHFYLYDRDVPHQDLKKIERINIGGKNFVFASSGSVENLSCSFRKEVLNIENPIDLPMKWRVYRNLCQIYEAFSYDYHDNIDYNDCVLFEASKQIFGSTIKPGTLSIYDNTNSVEYVDNGRGSIIYGDNKTAVGKVFYKHGLMMFTSSAPSNAVPILEYVSEQGSYGPNSEQYTFPTCLDVSPDNPSGLVLNRSGEISVFDTGSMVSYGKGDVKYSENYYIADGFSSPKNEYDFSPAMFSLKYYVDAVPAFYSFAANSNNTIVTILSDDEDFFAEKFYPQILADMYNTDSVTYTLKDAFFKKYVAYDYDSPNDLMYLVMRGYNSNGTVAGSILASYNITTKNFIKIQEFPNKSILKICGGFADKLYIIYKTYSGLSETTTIEHISPADFSTITSVDAGEDNCICYNLNSTHLFSCDSNGTISKYTSYLSLIGTHSTPYDFKSIICDTYNNIYAIDFGNVKYKLLPDFSTSITNSDNVPTGHPCICEYDLTSQIIVGFSRTSPSETSLVFFDVNTLENIIFPCPFPPIYVKNCSLIEHNSICNYDSYFYITTSYKGDFIPFSIITKLDSNLEYYSSVLIESQHIQSMCFRGSNLYGSGFSFNDEAQAIYKIDTDYLTVDGPYIYREGATPHYSEGIGVTNNALKEVLVFEESNLLESSNNSDPTVGIFGVGFILGKFLLCSRFDNDTQESFITILNKHDLSIASDYGAWGYGIGPKFLNQYDMKYNGTDAVYVLNGFGEPGTSTTPTANVKKFSIINGSNGVIKDSTSLTFSLTGSFVQPSVNINIPITRQQSNCSNNPTYYNLSGAAGDVKTRNLDKKETYFTSLYIYDDQKNLVGIAKINQPIIKDNLHNYIVRIKYEF